MVRLPVVQIGDAAREKGWTKSNVLTRVGGEALIMPYSYNLAE